jgi:tetratricopeptide (TPR) repeat protein
MEHKKLKMSVGIPTLEKLREDSCIYVDKLYNLLLILLFASGCNSLPSEHEQKSELAVAKDTVFASRVDSVKWVLATGTEAQKKKSLQGLSRYYASSDKTLSIQYANDLLHLAQQTKDRNCEGDAYNCLAGGFFYDNQTDSTLFYRYKALAIYEEINDDLKSCVTKLNISKSLATIMKFDEALKLLHECLEYYTHVKPDPLSENLSKDNIDYQKAQVLQSIGELYLEMQLFDLSISYFQQALTVYEPIEKTTNVKRQSALCYTNIGEIYFRKDDFEKAIEYRNKSLEILRSINELYYIGVVLKGRSNAYAA